MKRFKCIRCNELEELRGMVVELQSDDPCLPKWETDNHERLGMEELWAEELKEVSMVRNKIRLVMPCWTGDSYWCILSKTFNALKALGYSWQEIMFLIDYRELEEEFTNGAF